MTEMIYVSQPLPLAGALNVRDLGGYVAIDGRVTHYRQFLRADSLHALNDKDKNYLFNYGVRLVIDLRDIPELAVTPFSLPEAIRYTNIPLLDNINSNNLDITRFPPSLHELYIDNLLEGSKPKIAQVLTAAAEGDGCVLFNCAAGKDRTGVITMLLLLIAGVRQDQIIADYAATEGNMKSIFDSQRSQLQEQGYTDIDYLFASHPEEMEITLTHFNRAYGDAETYCRSIGLDDHLILRLRSKLLG